MTNFFSRPAMTRLLFQGVLFVFFVTTTPTLSSAHEIAILISADFPPYHQAAQGFTSHLPTETTFTTYQLKSDLLEGREMAKRVRASSPDLVLVVGLKAALVAKLEIIDIPTVFCLVLNPEDYGLPASNMVGIQLRVSSQDQLQTLLAIVPSAKTVGLLFDPDKSHSFVDQARKEAQAVNLSLVTQEVSQTSELPDTLRNLLPQIDVLWLFRDSTVITASSIPFLLETALEFRKPVFGFSSGLAQHGATASISVNYDEVGHQAADLAKDILRTGSLSPTGPKLFFPHQTRLALNLGTSRFLGLTPNPQIVRLADSVFGGSSAFAQLNQSSKTTPSLNHSDQGTFLIP